MSEGHYSKTRLEVVSDYTTFAIGFRKLCILILMRRRLASPVVKHDRVLILTQQSDYDMDWNDWKFDFVAGERDFYVIYDVY